MITVSTIINVPIGKVWDSWTDPAHIVNWNNASDDWHTPRAVNDLRKDGRFIFTMAAKDGSFSFDFGGTYTAIDPQKKISYILDDGRVADVLFEQNGSSVTITEIFQAENIHSLDMQEAGWQAILNNFKKYTENLFNLT
ncbi:MAG: SRPBCC family protein [Chitinophagaceae bacterium]|nr:SRPBCC family protein [Chitinophagaceae bacterium]